MKDMHKRDTHKIDHPNEECDCEDSGGQQKQDRKL